MFRRFAKSMHKPVLWLMLPLAVLAGRPSAGCVCGDGTFMTVCCKSNWLFAGVGAVPNLGLGQAKEAKCCGQSPSATCPHCCNTAQGHRDSGSFGCSAAGGCQCQALANNVEPTKITDWSVDAAAAQLLVPAEILVAWPPVLSRHSLSARFEALPPPDRVVLFLHLTI